MCDPISIAGAALSGAGMAANSIAANQVSSATNAAEQQTAMLNQVASDRAFAQNRNAEKEYKGFAAGQTAMGQQLGDYLAKNSVGRVPPASQMAPTGVSTGAAVTAGAPGVTAYGQQQAGALGQMNSFGDFLAEKNRAAGRHLQLATMNDDFMRQNNAVLGLQLNDASHAGDTASLIGSVAGGLGGAAMKAGLTGYGSNIGSLFGGDVSSSDAAGAGLAAGLTRSYDPKTGWSIG